MSKEDIDPSGSSLIPIDDLFNSRKLLGKSIADIAIESLQPLIDQLPDKSRIFALGNSHSSGGNFSGSIRTLGNLRTKNMVVTDNLNVAGNSSVKDLLIVRENTTIAGNTSIDFNAVFGGKTELVGNVNIGANVIASKSLTLAGTVEVGGQIISDGDVTTKRRVTVDKIQTLGHLRSYGVLNVKNGIRGNSISLLDPDCEIYGDIEGSKVGIGRKKILKRYITNYDAKSSLLNPFGLVRFVFGSAINAIRGVKGKNKATLVEGDIIAEDLFLENCVVNGSINAKRIIIGDNVDIKGEIEYSEYLRVLTETEYPAKQIEEAQILFFPLDKNN